MIDFSQFFPEENDQADLERRVVVLETVITELLRRLDRAEQQARGTAQGLSRASNRGVG